MVCKWERARKGGTWEKSQRKCAECQGRQASNVVNVFSNTCLGLSMTMTFMWHPVGSGGGLHTTYYIVWLLVCLWNSPDWLVFCLESKNSEFHISWPVVASLCQAHSPFPFFGSFAEPPIPSSWPRCPSKVISHSTLPPPPASCQELAQCWVNPGFTAPTISR